jgi:hypothetical protein
MISFLRFRFCARARQVDEHFIMSGGGAERPIVLNTCPVTAAIKTWREAASVQAGARLSGCPDCLRKFRAITGLARRVALPWCVFHIFSSIGCDSRAHVVDRPAAGTLAPRPIE